MRPPGGSRLRAATLALVVAGAALAAQSWWTREPRLVYSRFDLPAFDAYAYVAMAEQPRFFTVAPWGYRVLTPALAHLAAGGEPARVLRGFRLVNAVALLAAALLLWRFQRELGMAQWAALAGAAAFLLSPPVAELLRNPYLTDSVTVALESALLLALQAGAALPVLVLVAVAGSLAKESFLLLLPVVYFARAGRDGRRRAFVQAAAAGLAAAAATVLLRAWWTPHLAAPVPAAEVDTLAGAAANLRFFAGRHPWAAWTVAGIAAGAALAARRPEGRRLLARYGYAALAALAAPFFNPVVFSAGDVRRLWVHALPVLVPVCVAALPRAWGAIEPPAAPRRRSATNAAAAAAALLLLASPLLLDRYRRADLQGSRDGPLVLAFCRDSLRSARRLQRGETVTFDLASRRFEWGVSDPGQLERMRWFLRAGWGDLPHYGTADVVVQAPRADLIVPSLDARPLHLTLHLAAEREAAGRLLVNGRPAGSWRAPGPPQTWRLDSDALFRGDNRVTLEVAAGDPRAVRLERVSLAPARP